MKTYIYILLSISLIACKTTASKSTTALPKGTKKITEKEAVVFAEKLIEGLKYKEIADLDPAINRGTTTTKYASAIQQLEACLKIDPSQAAPNYVLANIYSKDPNLLTQAAELAQRASNADPKNEYYLKTIATIYENQKEYTKLTDVYRKLHDLNPTNLEYAFGLAATYMYQNNNDKAIGVFNEIEKRTGMLPELTNQKKELYLKMNKFEKAEEEVKKLIKEYPYEYEHLTILAELYEANDKKDKALEVYKELALKDPSNPSIGLSMYEHHKSDKNTNEAFQSLLKTCQDAKINIDEKVKIIIKDYYPKLDNPSTQAQTIELTQAIAKAHPTEAKAWSLQGDVYSKAEKLPEARTAYIKTLEYDKSKLLIWRQLLVIDSELQDYAALLKHSDETIEIAPTQPDIYYFKGAALVQLKKYNEAIEAFQEGMLYIVTDAKLSAEFQARIAEAYHYLKNYAKSDNAFNTALQLDATNNSILNNYAYYLAERKTNLEKANEMAQKINNQTPNIATYQDTYAWVLYAQKKYEEANTWIDKAISNGGEKDGAILEHKADILYKMNKQDAAMEYWQKAKSLPGVSESINKKIQDKKTID